MDVNSTATSIAPGTCSTDGGGTIESVGMYTLSSYHNGGANILMLDGAVKFLKGSASNQTVWSIGSMNQGEIIDGNSF